MSLGFSAVDHPELAAAIRGGFGRIGRSDRQRGVDQVAKRPHAIRAPELDGWRGPQAFVNPAQIVMGNI